MKKWKLLTVACALCVFSTQGTYAELNGSNNPRGKFLKPHAVQLTHRGLASWYGSKFHGRKMANGKRFNMYRLSVAHNTLPFGTVVRVTNLNNGRQVVAEVTDTGRFDEYGRIIDLSYRAAQAIGAVDAGVVPVKVDVLRHRKGDT